MNIARAGMTDSLKFAMGVSSVAIAASLQMPALAASTDQPVSAAAQARSAVIQTPTARGAKTKVETPDHAGATVMSDDDSTTDDTSDKTKAAAVSPTGDQAVPVVEYSEKPEIQALCRQATALNGQKQYAQATTVLRSAITRDPKSILARRLYAQTTLMAQDNDSAIQMLETLAKYTRPTAFDKCLLGSAYFAKGSGSAAVIQFKGALDLNPGNFYAEEGYIRSLILARNFALAAPECGTALQKFKAPSEQAVLKKLWAQVVAERAADNKAAPPAGDSRLSPPIPLKELTPFLIKGEYGG